jgi:hypothetical protein
MVVGRHHKHVEADALAIGRVDDGERVQSGSIRRSPPPGPGARGADCTVRRVHREAGARRDGGKRAGLGIERDLLTGHHKETHHAVRNGHVADLHGEGGALIREPDRWIVRHDRGGAEGDEDHAEEERQK